MVKQRYFNKEGDVEDIEQNKLLWSNGNGIRRKVNSKLRKDEFHKFEYNNDIPIVNINIEDDYLDYSLIYRNYGCQDIFIFHENSALIFDEFEYAILYNITKERYMQRRYVLMTSREDIENMLQYPRLEFVKDLLMIHLESSVTSYESMIPDTEEAYRLFTHSFGGEFFNELWYLDVWFSKTGMFKDNADLFPDKIKNLYGRPFRLLSVPYQPNTIIRNGKHAGTELGPMLIYCEKYNYTPKYIIAPENAFGQIYENGSSDGLTKFIVDGDGEVAFGSIGRWVDYYDYSEFAKPMIRSGITCIVPLPGLVIGWQVPLITFSVEMWLSMIFTIIFCSIVYYYFRILYIKRSKKSTYDPENIPKARICYFSCTDVLAMYMLQPIKIPKDRLIRYLLIIILYTVVSVTNAYSSGLYSILAVPRIKKSIDSVQDMADSELIWAGGTEAWITTIYYYEEPKFRTIIKNFIYDDGDVIRNMSLANKYGFVMERLPYGHYGLQEYIKRDVIGNYRIMKEDIYWEYWIYMHRKNSVLLDSIDFFILRFFQSGLSEYQETRVVLDFFDSTVQEAIFFNTHNTHRDVIKLQWEHVEGAFSILGFGYIIGFITLILENSAEICKKYSLLKLKLEA